MVILMGEELLNYPSIPRCMLDEFILDSKYDKACVFPIVRNGYIDIYYSGYSLYPRLFRRVIIDLKNGKRVDITEQELVNRYIDEELFIPEKRFDEFQSNLRDVMREWNISYKRKEIGKLIADLYYKKRR